jgi:hypothetical protein
MVNIFILSDLFHDIFFIRFNLRMILRQLSNRQQMNTVSNKGLYQNKFVLKDSIGRSVAEKCCDMWSLSIAGQSFIENLQWKYWIFCSSAIDSTVSFGNKI